VLGQPVEAFHEAVTAHGTGGLDEPGAAADRVQTELVGDFGAAHGAGQVLLVSEDEKHGVLEFLFAEHLVKLVAVLLNALLVVGVDDEDETLRVLVVVSPEQSDLVLTTDIPHVERDVLVVDGLHVEANRGDGVDDLAELHLVEDGGLARGVETNHQDSHFLGADHAVPELSEQRSKSEAKTPRLGRLRLENFFLLRLREVKAGENLLSKVRLG